VAEKGFFWKENQALAQIENLTLEVTDIQCKSIMNQECLEELYGHGNRLLNGNISENVPIYQTVNYLPPQTIFHS